MFSKNNRDFRRKKKVFFRASFKILKIVFARVIPVISIVIFSTFALHVYNKNQKHVVSSEASFIKENQMSKMDVKAATSDENQENPLAKKLLAAKITIKKLQEKNIALQQQLTVVTSRLDRSNLSEGLKKVSIKAPDAENKDVSYKGRNNSMPPE